MSGHVHAPVQRELRREVNDRILETYSFIASDQLEAYESCELFCECARHCEERILVPASVIHDGRGSIRFFVCPGHTVDGEVVLEQERGYWIIADA